jgi:hypothetical protein
MAATPTAMPWRPAAGKNARQTASFDASRANSSFKTDVEEIISVIAYAWRRKQKRNKLWVYPFVADRPTNVMVCKIYSYLRIYPDKFFGYLRLSIGSFEELLTISEIDLTKQDTILFHYGCSVYEGSDASSISTWHLGSDAKLETLPDGCQVRYMTTKLMH